MIGFDDIEYASLSDVGIRRSHNQDAHAALPANELELWQRRGHVFLVADGMGAHAVGELASKLAADGIPHIYSKHAQEGAVAALRRAFVETNLCIHTRGQQNREFAGMGTTGTALVLRPEGAWIAHVGDSRCYRIRAGQIEQLSFDHSLVWELAKRQHKNPEELQGVPSNVIVRSLGPEPLVQVDVEGPHPVEPDDYYVLCSDGLSGPVSDREIGAVVRSLPPEEACRFLIHLANLQGGPDNITAVVIHIGTHAGGPSSDSPLAASRPKAKGLSGFAHAPWPLLLIFLGIVLAVVAIYFVVYNVPGEIPAFVAAAIAMLGGLSGLVLQKARESRSPPVIEEDDHGPHVYRDVSCVIDKDMVQQLTQATATLEERIREKGWQVDWASAGALIEASKSLLQKGDWEAAFRTQCRAMLLLMDAVSLQRSKEESFKPLWDKTPA